MTYIALGPGIAPDRLDTGFGWHGVDQHHPVPVVQELPGLYGSWFSNLSKKRENLFPYAQSNLLPEF